MEVFLRIEANIIIAVLLFFVQSNASKILSRKDKLNRIFLAMSQITLVELIIEALTCLVNGKEGILWLIASQVLHTVLFILTPMVTYLWSQFLSVLIPVNSRKNKTKMLLIPLVINAVISGTSSFTGLVFIVNNENIYSHGILFIMPAIITYFYLICNLIYIIRIRKSLTNNEFTALLCFGVIPAVAGVIQTVFHGALLMWSSTAVALVIVFIYLQQKMIQIDALTGAWTRSSFENYLEDRVTKGSKTNNFAVIFIDLDKFKQINDKYGHLEGDKALKNTVNIIKSALGNEDIIARFGGDEFIILLDTGNKIKIEKTIVSIKNKFERYNKTSGKDYKIEYSYGYEIYNRRRYKNILHFLNHVDTLMYKNKEAK